MKTLPVTGIVLAGGLSSRMGQDKSLMEFKGKPLIAHAVHTLRNVCNQVVISSNRSVYTFTGCEVWPDEVDIRAPMAGIYTCLRRSETAMNIVLSCDMPMVDSRLFPYLLQTCSDCDAIIPVHREGMEPLCGIYGKAMADLLATHIRAEKFSLQHAIREAGGRLVEIGPELDFYRENMFANINTRGDFGLLIKM